MSGCYLSQDMNNKPPGLKSNVQLISHAFFLYHSINYSDQNLACFISIDFLLKKISSDFTIPKWQNQVFLFSNI